VSLSQRIEEEVAMVTNYLTITSLIAPLFQSVFRDLNILFFVFLSEDRSRRIDEDRTSNDWRSDTRELPPARNGNEYPSYDNDSYRGRRMDRSSGGFDRSYNRERDFGDVRSEPRDFNRFDRDSRGKFQKMSSFIYSLGLLSRAFSMRFGSSQTYTCLWAS